MRQLADCSGLARAINPHNPHDLGLGVLIELEGRRHRREHAGHLGGQNLAHIVRLQPLFVPAF